MLGEITRALFSCLGYGRTRPRSRMLTFEEMADISHSWRLPGDAWYDAQSEVLKAFMKSDNPLTGPLAETRKDAD